MAKGHAKGIGINSAAGEWGLDTNLWQASQVRTISFASSMADNQ
jgi:hypothetical protein